MALGPISAWVYGTTGVPCPGCGVTRSLSCGLRGLWLESWNYHPMGLLILALFAFTAAQSLLPRAARERVTCWMQHHALAFNSAYLLFVLYLSVSAWRAPFLT